MRWLADNWNRVATVTATAVGLAVGLLGGWDASVHVLVSVMAADYIAGVALGFMGRSAKTPKGGVSSRVGFDGLLRKMLILVVVGVGASVDKLIGGGDPVFRSACIWFYVANEGLSLMENLASAGVPFPPALLGALEHMKQVPAEGNPPSTIDAASAMVRATEALPAVEQKSPDVPPPAAGAPRMPPALPETFETRKRRTPGNV